jgi:glycine cleavage system regulatory protein
MSGELLFEATATLRMPADTDPADLRATLESIANELMVDLDVTDQRTSDGTAPDEGR